MNVAREIQYELLDNIPVLAWLMQVTSSEMMIVKHGRMVECKSDFFVSGVWDGDFATGDFITSNFSCCSGGSLCFDDNLIVISTPSHLHETIYSFRDEEGLFFSNSLPFLLAKVNKDLDVNYYDYEADFCSIVFGERRLRNYTVLKNCEKILFYRNCNIYIASDLSIKQESKDRHPLFYSFDDYHTYMLDVLKGVALNAIDRNRLHKYGMISTVSRGYDAPAVSALVSNIGCTEALTLREPINDNGKQIACDLGYKQVHEVERDEYKRNHNFVEAEGAACGQIGGMIFEGSENLCSGKLIFMGTRGDSVWERLNENVNDELAFPYNGYAQASLSPVEHLFRINSIVVHVPLIGADSWPDIAKISNSVEMNAWSVGDRYDRPIARRILEEKGIQRNEFGQIKLGAGVSFHFNTLNSLKQKMSPNSYEALVAFKKNLKCNRIKEFLYKISFAISEFPIYFNYLMAKLKIHCSIDESSQGHKSSPISNLLILWGVHEMKKRYKL